MRKRDLLRSLPGLLIATGALAQQPRWSAAVLPVERPGLHAIVLSPAVVGRSRADLGDLRLVDGDGGEVPYEPVVEPRRASAETFIPFTVLRNEVLGERTVLELELPPDAITSSLHLRVRNADVDKPVRITGSDDSVRWYMVKDARVAVRGTRGDPPRPVLSIALPHVDRRYLRVELDDSLAAPVQIIDAGMFATAEREGRMVRDTSFRWTRRDTASRTILAVRARHPLVIDRLAFVVADTLPFRREARIVTWRERTTGRGRKRRTRREEVVLARFTVSSADGGLVELDGLRADTFEVRIENGDDRPLRLTTVEAWQRERSLRAHLLPDAAYRLTTGDDKAHAPRYDLTPFRAAGNAPPITIGHGPLEELPDAARDRPPFDPSGTWIWVAVAGLALAMAMVAFRLMRGMGQGGA